MSEIMAMYVASVSRISLITQTLLVEQKEAEQLSFSLLIASSFPKGISAATSGIGPCATKAMTQTPKIRRFYSSSISSIQKVMPSSPSSNSLSSLIPSITKKANDGYYASIKIHQLASEGRLDLAEKALNDYLRLFKNNNNNKNAMTSISSVPFSTFVDACRRNREWQPALLCYKRFRETCNASVIDDDRLIISLIECLASSGRVHCTETHLNYIKGRCLHLFKSYTKLGREPSLLLLNALLKVAVHCKDKDLLLSLMPIDPSLPRPGELVFRVFDRVEPSIVSYTLAIHAVTAICNEPLPIIWEYFMLATSIAGLKPDTPFLVSILFAYRKSIRVLMAGINVRKREEENEAKEKELKINSNNCTIARKYFQEAMEIMKTCSKFTQSIVDNRSWTLFLEISRDAHCAKDGIKFIQAHCPSLFCRYSDITLQGVLASCNVLAGPEFCKGFPTLLEKSISMKVLIKGSLFSASDEQKKYNASALYLVNQALDAAGLSLNYNKQNEIWNTFMLPHGPLYPNFDSFTPVLLLSLRMANDKPQKSIQRLEWILRDNLKTKFTDLMLKLREKKVLFEHLLVILQKLSQRGTIPKDYRERARKMYLETKMLSQIK